MSIRRAMPVVTDDPEVQRIDMSVERDVVLNVASHLARGDRRRTG
jgi:hypothetical protein